MWLFINNIQSSKSSVTKTLFSESWRDISVGILLPLQTGGSAFDPQNYIHNVKSLGKYMHELKSMGY